MKLAVNRIIYFTNQMKTMTAFYRDVIGLSPIDNAESDPSGFLEFDAGACTIALHKGSPGKPATRNKIVFFTDDVAATREELIRRGAKMGTFNPKGSLHLCDGKDPEGNKFQISNRVRQKG
jgi:predicted enzyme related to lactoylglutathione lyase